MYRRRLRRTAIGLTALAISASALQSPTAWSRDRRPEDTAGTALRQGNPSSIPVHDREKTLGSGWRRSSDRAWTTTSDADGFHVLAAERQSGYAWRTVATLREPGFDADMWIGNACLTASGKRAVVVYAPRTFTNKPELMARGGFTAVVDLQAGSVTKLPIQASLSHYNPGCGASETAVLTQSAGEDRTATRLTRVDATTGKLARPVEVVGQVTSAVPAGRKIVAAAAGAVVSIDDRGKASVVAKTRAVPYRLVPDRDGGVAFLDKASAGMTQVERVSGHALRRADGRAKADILAQGPLADTGITRSASGTVFVTGSARPLRGARSLPVRVVQTPKGSRVSTNGEAVVTRTEWADKKIRQDNTSARPVNIGMEVPSTKRKISFGFDPAAHLSRQIEQGQARSPAFSPRSAARKRAAGSNGDPHNPVENEATCAVPRNDPKSQAVQPKPRQVEWAVNRAVFGGLKITRPANWKNLGMPSYTPQGLFPKTGLEGGGRVPAQIMLGITAQESNMWQAARFAVPGVSANPLIGNFYGVDYYDGNDANDWDINWAKADCGYGVTQVTDGMRKGQLDSIKQRAIALDYTANISRGLQIITEKWNVVRKAGMKVNNGDPAKIENWWFALWAYNSGFYPQGEAGKNGGAWGLGWANNPANPEWDYGRAPFLENSYADASHPQDWPYQEKVLGWAGHPLEGLEEPGKFVVGFRPAWWVSAGERIKVKPEEEMFCHQSINSCDPAKVGDGAQNEPGRGPCGRSDFKCWWTSSVTWKPDCDKNCGNEVVRWPDNGTNEAEEPDGTSYPPNCSLNATGSGNQAPTAALIVDDDTNPTMRSGCPRPAAQEGTFRFTFAGSNGLYPSKIDLQQLGAGFGSHFFFSHTRKADTPKGEKLKIAGVWKLNKPQKGWFRIAVHLPDHGAHTQQAKYEIDDGTGFTPDRARYINQKRQANNWVSLGVYEVNGTPAVRLSNTTRDGYGEEDIAWDSVAFQPLPDKPKHIVAALGDSYSSGEGAGDYIAESDRDHGNRQWNACRRSKNSWIRRTGLAGLTGTIGDLSDRWSTAVELGFVACSGAQTWNVTGDSYPLSWDDPASYEKGEGQFHEIAQLESGAVTKDTTLVTLSIGGNDAGGGKGGLFSDAILNCVVVGVCSEGDFTKRVDSIQSPIADIIRRISSLAPKAQIILMGYPRIAEPDSPCLGSGVQYKTLNKLADYMADKQSQTVTELKKAGLKADFANPRGDFSGHGICANAEWINKFVVAPTGEGDVHPDDHVALPCIPLGGACASRESFHPNKSGTAAYSDVLRNRLVALGMGHRKSQQRADER
ncbi:SGNH/GDSL hydrolase family protein [Streptomyces caniferus]|uniref:golvesin C-terminal-like domain-containing protein n=1 Tax=Streptomyces caniferus TaxID=285557 RepID=UPI003455609A